MAIKFLSGFRGIDNAKQGLRRSSHLGSDLTSGNTVLAAEETFDPQACFVYLNGVLLKEGSSGNGGDYTLSGNATVTLAHSRTKNLKKLTKQADIIIMALGIPEFLTSDMVKDNVCVIDVGITRVVDKNNPKGYVIKGDVDFKDVSKKANYITPVPGGVGPMTIAMLLQNTLQARQWNLS